MYLLMMLFFWVLTPCRPLPFSPEDGDSMFLRNVSIYRRVYTAPKPRRALSSSPPQKPQISNNNIGCAVYLSSAQLTWRDIQHLTVLTSKRNSLFDAKGRFHWTMNGVGLEFNHLFGFGVLDAGAMVALAKQWKTVPARYHCEGGTVSETQ
jgi:hypothetical protein